MEHVTSRVSGGEFRVMLLYVYIYFFGFFLCFSSKNLCFYSFISLFDEVSNFRNRILKIRNQNWWKEIVSETVCKTHLRTPYLQESSQWLRLWDKKVKTFSTFASRFFNFYDFRWVRKKSNTDRTITVASERCDTHILYHSVKGIILKIIFNI